MAVDTSTISTLKDLTSLVGQADGVVKDLKKGPEVPTADTHDSKEKEDPGIAFMKAMGIDVPN